MQDRPAPPPEAEPPASPHVEQEAQQQEEQPVEKRDESADAWYRDYSVYDPEAISMAVQQALDEGLTDEELIREVVCYMMNRYAAVFQYHEVCIAVLQKRLEDGDDQNHDHTMVLLKEREAQIMFMTPKVIIPPQPTGETDKRGNPKMTRPKQLTPYNIWIEHPKRRVINGVIFDPLRRFRGDDILNSWTGLRYTFSQVELDAGIMMYQKNGFDLFHYLEFLFNSVHGQDALSWRHNLLWMALILQHPETNTGVCYIYGGDEGTGKSTACTVFGHLFGPHYLKTSNLRDVSGTFNSMIVGKCLCHVDEVDDSSKQDQAMLKALITDPGKRTERKFHASQIVNQPCNLMLTSNRLDEDILNVGAQQRRFAIIHTEVKDRTNVHTPQGLEFFNNMHSWLEGDDMHPEYGYKAFFYFLMSLDLTGFEVRDIPITKIMLERKLSSMPKEHTFMLECLKRRQISVPSCMGLPIPWVEVGGLRIREVDFVRAYTDWCKPQQLKPNNAYKLLSIVREVIPQLKSKRGPQTIIVNDAVPVNGKPFLINQNEHTVSTDYLLFPSIEDCLQSFYAKYTGMEVHHNVTKQFTKRHNPKTWQLAPFKSLPVRPEFPKLKIQCVDDGETSSPKPVAKASPARSPDPTDRIDIVIDE